MLKRHAPSRQKRRGRLPLPPRSSPSAVTSPTSKRSKIAPLFEGKNDTTCDSSITTSSRSSSSCSSSVGASASSSANGVCESAGLRISRRGFRPFVTVERAKGLLGRLNSFNPEPGCKSPTTAVTPAIDTEETDLSDLAHQHPQKRPINKHIDGMTHRRGSAPKQPRVSPDAAHHGEAETIAARSRGRRSSSGRPEAVGPASRHPSSSRPPSRPKKQRGARGSGVVEEEAEIEWREPTPSQKRKSPAASPSPKSPAASGGDAVPNGKRTGGGLSRGRCGRDLNAGNKQSEAGNDTQGAARGVESTRKLELRVAAKDKRVTRGKARGDGGVPSRKPIVAPAAVAQPPPIPTPTPPAAAPASAPASAPEATATVPKRAAAPALTAAATPAAAVAANGGSGSASKGASEAKGVLPLPVPTPKQEELPRCPYPGHKNVSWRCRACGGAAHHLTSRFAMEPLQRVHGFKVHRVPNDGDCFFSSIKAALEAGSETCGDNGDAGAGMAMPPAAAGLTVGKMREWVAEETGEEQLAFYALQAKANPEDRWLDFVRPLDERVRSDDEEEEEGEEKVRGKRGKGTDDDNNEGRENDSSEESSESASQWSETTTVVSSDAGSQRRGWRSQTKDGPKVGGGTTAGSAARGTRRSKRGGVSPARKSETDVRTPSGGNATDRVEATSSASTEAARNDREALSRRRGRPRSKGLVEVQGAAMAGSAAAVGGATTKKSTKTTPTRKSNACSQPFPRRTGSTTFRRSTRVRTRVGVSSVDEGDEEGAGGGAKERDATDGEQENREKKSGRGEEEEKDEEEEKQELPVVTTLDELRRFVRLEGSVVGHGRCMWADTFAHHVVSRRLGLTILFVDMEREKSAWPYRVLARATEDGKGDEEERFVVLKREPNHFVPVKTAPPPAEKAPPSAEKAPHLAEKEGGKAGEHGGHGVTATAPLSGWGQACFRRSELPEVVQKLWKIEPKVARPVLPPPPEAGQSSTTAAAAAEEVIVS